MLDLIRMVRTLAWLSLFAALYQELRRPSDERTWHGKVGGVIPYDFRVPTLDRIRRAYWDPGRDEVFSEHVFGVGWAVNLPVLARRLNAGATQYFAISRRRPARGRSAPAEDDAAD